MLLNHMKGGDIEARFRALPARERKALIAAFTPEVAAIVGKLVPELAQLVRRVGDASPEMVREEAAAAPSGGLLGRLK